jgi:mannose-6-phosphate isomerase-like protein (cupin superfamily)
MPRIPLMSVLAVLLLVSQAVTFSQSRPTAATYITDEEVKAVNATPGVDRTIRVVDIGNEHFAVGIIHRVAAGAARGTGGGAGAGAAAGAGRATGSGGATGPAPMPCGEQASTPPTGATPGGITHDSQTEGYVIVSGSGTLITGGHIVNGTKSAPESAVTRELNGPSCSGMIAGSDVVKRMVKTGDIIIIPAGVPHGWTDITDHVDYLSLRPSGQILQAGYVHPAISKR